MNIYEAMAYIGGAGILVELIKFFGTEVRR